MKVPQLHVGIGSTLGPLTIFPVWTEALGQLGISTGTHADVAVSELASGAQVSKLTVTNNGARPALLLEGELLEGGQQHRTCARDVLLGVGETRGIDAYCVEAGRWEKGEDSHRRQGRRAPLNVRAELASRSQERGGADRQDRIWERIRRFDSVRGASATSSLLDHLDAHQSPGAARRLDNAQAPDVIEGQRGVVIGLGTQPLLLEFFGTHTLFRRHYRQLIDSALMDLDLLPPHMSLASGAMPGQGARDFAAKAHALDFGRFDGDTSALEIRRHGSLQSRNLNLRSGAMEAGGLAVVLPDRQPEMAHMTAWNTKHPLMEIA